MVLRNGCVKQGHKRVIRILRHKEIRMVLKVVIYVKECRKLFGVQRVYLVGDSVKFVLLLIHGKYRPFKFYIIKYGIKK